MKLRHIRLLALMAAIPLSACSDDDGNGPVSASNVRLLNAVTSAGEIKLRLDAGDIVTGLDYNEAPTYARVRSGSRTLAVRAQAGTADLLSKNVNLGTDQSYTVIYAGRTGATGAIAPRFIELTDNGANPPADNGSVRVVHASAGAPASVDVYLLEEDEELADATADFTAIDFAEIAAYANRAVGTYTIVVTATGTKTAAITLADVDLEEGERYTIVVLGDPTVTAAAPLAVRVLTDQ